MGSAIESKCCFTRNHEKKISPVAALAYSSKSSRIGTPIYMSPEMHRSLSKYSANTDCWSIGCVLYELITFERIGSKIELDEPNDTLLQNQIDEFISKLKLNEELIKDLLQR